MTAVASNDVAIVRRPVKHARLRVREDTSVQLVVPADFPDSLIENLLRKKARWIARHQGYFRDRYATQRTVAAGHIILFGKTHRPAHLPALGSRVEVDEAASEIRSGRDLALKPELDRWYRQFARAFLSDRVRVLSAQHKLPFTRLFIRSQRTKWGSCSPTQNISLNWRLILTPKHVIDYVILHELLHTKLMNHTHAFWVHLRAICPEAERAIGWLKERGHLICDELSNGQ